MTTIGVIGAGKLAPKMIRSLLDDQLEALDEIELLLPATAKHFTDEVDTVLAWAGKNEVEVTFLVNGKVPKEIADEVDEAPTIEVAKGSGVAVTMAQAVAEEDGRLFVLWDDEDTDGYKAFEAAHEAGVPCFDMVNGLEELTFADEDEEAAPEPEEGEEEPESTETPEEPVEDEEEPSSVAGEDLKDLSVADLKKILAERGITLTRDGKGRIAKGAYVAAIEIHADTGATVFVQEGSTAVPVEQEYLDAAEEYTGEEETAEILDDPEAMAAIDEAEGEPSLPVEEVESKQDKDPGIILPIESATATSGTGVSTTFTYVAPQDQRRPDKVGECHGCGGPFFALHEDGGGQVWAHHAEKCPLA